MPVSADRRTSAQLPLPAAVVMVSPMVGKKFMFGLVCSPVCARAGLLCLCLRIWHDMRACSCVCACSRAPPCAGAQPHAHSYACECVRQSRGVLPEGHTTQLTEVPLRARYVHVGPCRPDPRHFCFRAHTRAAGWGIRDALQVPGCPGGLLWVGRENGAGRLVHIGFRRVIPHVRFFLNHTTLPCLRIREVGRLFNF